MGVAYHVVRWRQPAVAFCCGGRAMKRNAPTWSASEAGVAAGGQRLLCFPLPKFSERVVPRLGNAGPDLSGPLRRAQGRGESSAPVAT